MDEEGQLRVLEQLVDADLPPAQVVAVRTPAVPLDGLASEAALDGRHLRHLDDPAEPAAAVHRALLDRATERCGVCGGVVECGDDLEVGATGEGEHEVAGAETRVDATVGEAGTEARSQPLHDLREVVGRCRV